MVTGDQFRSSFSQAVPLSRLTGSAKGAYLLLVTLSETIESHFGKVGYSLPAGRYAYCGSAKGPGGIAARVARHMRPDKPVHWHVDQLTMAAHRIEALAFPGGNECDLVAQLLATGTCSVPLPGFGSSDCNTCQSHLLRLEGDYWIGGSKPSSRRLSMYSTSASTSSSSR